MYTSKWRLKTHPEILDSCFPVEVILRGISLIPDLWKVKRYEIETRLLELHKAQTVTDDLAHDILHEMSSVCRSMMQSSAYSRQQRTD